MKPLEMKRRDCPLCQSASKALLYTDRNRRDGLDVTASYVRCPDCGMVYMDPIPDFGKFTNWDDVYVSNIHYKPTALLKHFSLMMWHWNALWDKTSRLHHLPDEPGEKDGYRQRILDVGCNTGSALVSFAKRGYEVWGIDMSGEAVAEARARLPEGHFLHGDFFAAELPYGTFDVIRADAVLEHVEDPVGFVHKCGLLLKPSGRLFLYFPNYNSVLQNIFGPYNINSWIPFHVNFFTRESTKRALTSAGFRDSQVQTNTHTSYYPNSVRQLLCRNKPSFDSQNLGWLISLFIVVAPLHRLIDALGWGEELVVSAMKAKGAIVPT